MINNIKEKIFANVDQEKFWNIFRIIVIALLIVILVSFGGFTLSKYVSNVDVNVSPKVAFFVTDIGVYEDKIELGKLIPSNTPYTYLINVSNFKDDRRTNVNLEYEIEFVSTTNLPINIKIFRNTESYSGNGIMNTSELRTDNDGMHFLVYSNDQKYNFTYEENVTDRYILWVEFPEVYKTQPEKYQGAIELIEVKIEAKQVV